MKEIMPSGKPSPEILDDFKRDVLRKDGESDEDIEREAITKLNHLGLNIEDLRDKTVLDLGSGPSVIERSARQHGIDTVISMDPFRERLSNIDGLNRVRGRGQMMPFKDGSMDLILSISAPPNTASTEKRAKRVMMEIRRVLKDGGEARLASTLRFIEDELRIRKDSDILNKNFNWYGAEHELSDEEKQERFAFNEEALLASIDWMRTQGFDVEVVAHKSDDDLWRSLYPCHFIDDDGELSEYFSVLKKNDDKK